MQLHSYVVHASSVGTDEATPSSAAVAAANGAGAAALNAASGSGVRAQAAAGCRHGVALLCFVTHREGACFREKTATLL
jgi:hypothetical protein